MPGISVAVYNKYLLALANGTAVPNLSSATLRLALLTSSYTPNLDTHEFYSDLTNELPTAHGYTAEGPALASQSVSLNTLSDFVYLDGDDIVVSFSGFTSNFRYGALVVDTGTPSTSRLLFLIDFGANQSPTTTDYHFRWRAPSAGGIVKFVQA